ncbi:hypothetical protein HPB52_006551 [Rhipicephalus sanguineus]|uniref:Uncharacterized protein n=1 Tax=Rhipicephalus sanguineus TaxID=34632 RepID=A0A9D4QH29_RHISA|nr:hypothetical protein HPB52_006551 [Rhipicephalus sanguineus]
MYSWMSLVGHLEEAKGDLTDVSVYFKAEDVHTENLSLVGKGWINTEECTCYSCAGHRRKQFSRSECDLVVVMGIRDTSSRSGTTGTPCTMQRSVGARRSQRHR